MGYTTPAKQVDHIVPKAKQGTDDLSNLQSICVPCHDDKTLTDMDTRKRMARADGWVV